MAIATFVERLCCKSFAGSHLKCKFVANDCDLSYLRVVNCWKNLPELFVVIQRLILEFQAHFAKIPRFIDIFYEVGHLIMLFL